MNLYTYKNHHKVIGLQTTNLWMVIPCRWIKPSSAGIHLFWMVRRMVHCIRIFSIFVIAILATNLRPKKCVDIVGELYTTIEYVYIYVCDNIHI